ncbi:IroE protein [Acinetobacter sp. ANC 4558]|uniref:alpha/beta hydrolase n=1 Tax=Acinetobacter sp. ANC 4558 TaxID=1977876 RepID=UPI000A348C61|nr:alpha/beta hydrolase-fold protein [Acinetobacter sp. ANC 4558]OTG86336.1 IroE protein [Acinetobacter sp. ANC 4558]
MSNLFKKTLGYAFSALITVGLCTTIYAKPEIKPLEANIAELGSEYYDFKVKEFQSKDRQRTYKVWLGVPKTITNKQYEFYSIFMLDGNSAMSHLKEDTLKSLTEQNAPVLVAIGYKTNLPFESTLRSLDYTPAEKASAKPAPDPRNPERMSGGSAAFQKIIIQEIAPWVEQNVKLDANNRAIWGHSYGGLFVLDSLLNTDYFSHYFAASPSLSWADQRIINKIQTIKINQPTKKHVLLMEGDIFADSSDKQSPNFDSNGINNNRKILSIFNQQGVDAKFLIYPNLKHGEVFKASLIDILLNKFY